MSYFKAAFKGQSFSVAKEWKDFKVEVKCLPNLEIAGYPKKNLSSSLGPHPTPTSPLKIFNRGTALLKQDTT